MKLKINVYLTLLAVNSSILHLLPVYNAQAQAIDTSAVQVTTPKKQWFENIAIRGYAQVRYNRLLETNSKLKCEQCDKSWGEGGGFFLRRMRIIFFGNVHERVFIYIQPDFASSVSSNSLYFGQIRDAYFDVALDKNKEFRIRFGQSKIPFGFENMQSSQNRLPLDRSDAINSSFLNERDMGIFFYWAPDKIRKRFAMLVNNGLKGSGDYGVIGLGVFNGQSTNKPDANNEPHIVTRFTYPLQFKNGQIIEPGIQAYKGNFVVTPDNRTPATKVVSDFSYLDERIAASFVLYPQPFGIQAEYNIGRGPEFNPITDSIESTSIEGGYCLLSYMLKLKQQTLIPFFRMQYYNGGKKFETDARSYTVQEYEYGIEWQPFKNFELVAMYTLSERRFEDMTKPANNQKGNLLRLQAQLNF